MGKNNKYNLSKDEYDLSKDGDEIEIGSSSGTSTPDTNVKKHHTWLWLLFAALVVVGVIVATVLYKNHKADNNNNEVQTEQVVDSPEETTATEETIATEEAVTSEETVNEDTPTQTVTPTQPAHSKPLATSTPNSSSSQGTLSGDLEQDAKAVIRGEFGNGQARKDALGSAYSEVQSRVNEIYREKYSN